MVLISIAAFMACTIMSRTKSGWLLYQLGVCYTPAIMGGEYYRLITSMFLHFGFEHLLYNMLSLLFIGDMVETALGPVRYLLIYLAGGIAGNLCSTLIELRTAGEYSYSAGASGACFAMMGAVAYLAYRNRDAVGEAYGKRIRIVIGMMIIQSFLDTGTDAWAHVGGLAAGVILAIVLSLGQESDEKFRM